LADTVCRENGSPVLDRAASVSGLVVRDDLIVISIMKNAT
jgi:hypothetical protein